MSGARCDRAGAPRSFVNQDGNVMVGYTRRWAGAKPDKAPRVDGGSSA